MNSNYHAEVYNCLHRPCPEGYECCSEKTPDGVKPTYGLCCKSGSCKRTGHCSVPKGEKERYLPMEHYTQRIVETYDGSGSCNNWKYSTWILCGVSLILLLTVLILCMRKR